MPINPQLPILFTFDGQARSGKGTIVHAVRRSLQSQGIKTMLIDAGQVFRVLVVSAVRHGVDLDSPDAIDHFLTDEQMLQETTVFVKQVYLMDHSERDDLLYTLEVSANSAKIGARPKAQEFKDGLLRKWLHDANNEGYEVVLLDGRALEEVGSMLQDAGVCDYRIGLYFTCDAQMGARRTLGFSDRPHHHLSEFEKQEVQTLVDQIVQRNKSDSERTVHPIVPPVDAPTYTLPEFNHIYSGDSREMMVIDTSSEMTKDQMVLPLVEFFIGVAQTVKNT